MRLTIINGSPRGSCGTTRFLLKLFIRGFLADSDHQADIIDLADPADSRPIKDLLIESDRLVLAFPHYTDAMPGLVKKIIEDLYFLSLKKDIRFPPIGFIVHSHLPEAARSRPLEAYLTKLAARLRTEYLGTVIIGGSEGIRKMPAWMNRRIRDRFRTLGRRFGETGRFDPGIISLLAGPEKLSIPALSLVRIFHFTGLLQYYCDQEMKQYGSFERRFAQPYFSQTSSSLRKTNGSFTEDTFRSANETASC